MAYFGKNSSTFILPEHPKFDKIFIHHSSASHPGVRIRAPYERPPSGDMNAAGLKRRIAFGNKMKKIRDITPRTMQIFIFWKEKAEDILHLRGKKQERAKNELSILDGMMQSRYDMIHAPGGLLDILVKEFNAMAEIRLTLEYGDYLSLACRKLKDKRMDEMQWRVDRVDWTEAAQKIREEEEIALEEEQRHRTIKTPTPYLDSIREAAQILGLTEKAVRFQIVGFGERNDMCHSHLEAMILKGSFHTLAEKIVEDKKGLDIIYQNRPNDQIEMRVAIGSLANEWFKRIWEADGRVHWTPTQEMINRIELLNGV